jgi:peptide-methionine (S)-S-oxide reductase
MVGFLRIAIQAPSEKRIDEETMKRRNTLKLLQSVLMTTGLLCSSQLVETSIAIAQDTKPPTSGRVILERAGASAKSTDADKPSDSEKTDSTSASQNNKDEQGTSLTKSAKNPSNLPSPQFAVFGGGCFWCIEAVFERVWGVEAVVSGYSGGQNPNPSYEQVSTDQTGHAEVCQIQYDPNIVSYEELLSIFFKSHDPTLVNEQGPDHGTRYRSVIFTTDDNQKASVLRVMEELKKKRVFRGKIATEVSPLKKFYPAEDYHQDYFEKHPDQAYCEINIRPKIGKFEKGFKENSKLQKAKEEKAKKK